MAISNTLPNIPEYTVSEISASLRRTVEEAYPYVRIRGEISGYKAASSGHVYLNLKDEGAVLAAVCWRGVAAKLPFKPEDGLEVTCTGRISTYGGQSKYQLIIEYMEPAGVGALMALLEKRKKELAAEGLFDERRKQLLPKLPKVIGIITSPTGAVIRDMLHRIEERFPRHVLLWPVAVQGEGAAKQIAEAIKGFNTLPEKGAIPKPDVLIVARGGGSIEDLWAFNEEIVVRTAAASGIPLVSAVGHETDTTLIDYAADMRAPTPTAAAEFVVPVRQELLLGVQEAKNRLYRAMLIRLENYRQQVRALARALPKPTQMVAQMAQRIDGLGLRLQNAMPRYLLQKERQLQALTVRLRPHILAQEITRQQQALMRLSHALRQHLLRYLEQRRERLLHLSKLVQSYSYDAVLARGFALVRSGEKVITAAAQVKKGAALTLQFHDGKQQVVAVSGAGVKKKAHYKKEDRQEALF